MGNVVNKPELAQTNEEEISTEDQDHEVTPIDNEEDVEVPNKEEIEETMILEEYEEILRKDVEIEKPPDPDVQHLKDKIQELGRTVQVLAVENIELKTTEKNLRLEIQQLKVEGEKFTATTSASSDSYFPETPEDKIKRLEKNLVEERQEKWSAIENSEVVRVQLVNSERQIKEQEVLISSLQQQLTEVSKQPETVTDHSSKVTNLKQCYGEQDSVYEKHKSSTDLETFRADLKVKRELRQKALAAVSTELEQLRAEVANEKTLRIKLEKKLAKYEEGIEVTDVSEEDNVEERLMELQEQVQTIPGLKETNKRLQSEVRTLKEEQRESKTEKMRIQNDMKLEKRKIERLQTSHNELEKENERLKKQKKEWNVEKEQMWEDYDREKEEIAKRTKAMKEVIEISRKMLVIRENQVDQLKAKLKEIEENVACKISNEHENLRKEYEKQLENIRNLKSLYEERVRLIQSEKDRFEERTKECERVAEESKKKLEDTEKELEELKTAFENEKAENESLNIEIRIATNKAKECENDISIINNLFTQMLLGPYNNENGDLDKLTELLQENHDLLTDMTAKEESSEIASVLPKLLLDLITQVDKVEEDNREQIPSVMLESTETISEQSESLLADNQGAVLPIVSYKNATVFKTVKNVEETEKQLEPSKIDCLDPAVQEIASNLPKVWRVLMELLSHHTIPEEPTPGDEKQCYKYVETPYGTRSVISVSKTFIRLKDLILEKKSLQKALSRLKQLNLHLESRLEDQEKRLSLVQTELHKTWGIVGRMRAQHQQLHNHEKILRYELQEKRIMLSELKQELEYCKEKWATARIKNNESETEWKKLRKEFAARKSRTYINKDLNDSGESGYSDEQNESGEEEDVERSSTESPELKTERYNDVECSGAEEGGTETNSVCGSSRDSPAQADHDDGLDPRAVRLKKLEEQCQLLVKKVNKTTTKSAVLSNRLEMLHEQYGTNEEEEAGTSRQGQEQDIVEESSAGDETLQDEQQSEAEANVRVTECEAENGTELNHSEVAASILPLVVYEAIVVEQTAATSPVVENVGVSAGEMKGSSIPTAEEVSLSTAQAEEGMGAVLGLPSSPEESCSSRTENLSVHQESASVLVTTDERETGTVPRSRVTQETCTSSSENSSVIPTPPPMISTETGTVPRSRVTQETCTSSSENSSVIPTSPSIISTETGTVPRSQLTEEERLAARAARLQRLEEQCKLLVRDVNKTTNKSNYLSNRLEMLHEQYGSNEEQGERSSVAESGAGQNEETPTTSSTRESEHISEEERVHSNSDTDVCETSTENGNPEISR